VSALVVLAQSPGSGITLNEFGPESRLVVPWLEGSSGPAGQSILGLQKPRFVEYRSGKSSTPHFDRWGYGPHANCTQHPVRLQAQSFRRDCKLSTEKRNRPMPCKWNYWNKIRPEKPLPAEWRYERGREKHEKGSQEHWNDRRQAPIGNFKDPDWNFLLICRLEHRAARSGREVMKRVEDCTNAFEPIRHIAGVDRIRSVVDVFDAAGSQS
jgi:hypothetical protein